MLLERIESRGLAHYSYFVGDGIEATVIDPRRDCDVYVDLARNAGMKIVQVLETHRNEDYLIGSVELASRTGAEIWHAEPDLDYRYGRPVKDGQVFKVGKLSLEVMHTPGHTPGSVSYLLRNPGGQPYVLFSGDTLFAGDVGRVDLPGTDRMREMAALLYDSLTRRVLPLGDEVILCPGHGAGSTCGASIAGRTWTTIGIERRLNPRLKHKGRDQFVSDVAVELERPPYFSMMEKLNLQGAPLPGRLTSVAPVKPDDFARLAEAGEVLDVRGELAYGAAHIPGSLFLWQQGVASYAGWLLTYERPIYLVTSDAPGDVITYLLRMGFDDVAGYLAGGMLKWHMAGRESRAVTMLTVQELCRRLDEDSHLYILDVRSDEELENDGRIPGAAHIHMTLLPGRLDEVPRDRTVHVFCGSGLRSMTAASLLARSGRSDVAVVLGGLAGWTSTSCPIQ